MNMNNKKQVLFTLCSLICFMTFLLCGELWWTDDRIHAIHKRKFIPIMGVHRQPKTLVTDTEKTSAYSETKFDINPVYPQNKRKLHWLIRKKLTSKTCNFTGLNALPRDISSILYPVRAGNVAFRGCKDVKLKNHTETSLPEDSSLACEFVSDKARQLATYTSQPLCECPPKTLVGQFCGAHVLYQEGYLSTLYPDIKRGGEWKPSDCVPREKIAIIVPCKNRTSHIPILLNALHPFLRRQQLHYRIFIVEQVTGDLFNKGVTYNAGFKELMKLDKFDCVFFHDIDLLPEDDWNFYSCRHSPIHMSPRMDRSGYRWDPVRYAVGGVVGLKPEQYIKANGYSNLYMGWGGEDNNFEHRLNLVHLTISRPKASVACYTSVMHKRDKSFPVNPHRFRIGKIERSYPVLTRKNGLRSVKYEVIETIKRPLYTHIKIKTMKLDVRTYLRKMGKVKTMLELI